MGAGRGRGRSFRPGGKDFGFYFKWEPRREGSEHRKEVTDSGVHRRPLVGVGEKQNVGVRGESLETRAEGLC